MSEILSKIDINDYGIQKMESGGSAKLQEKAATPSTSQQVIEPDTGYDGMSSVTVGAVTSSIDSNIIPTNIRSGVSVLGVQGNLEPDKPDQSKTVTPSTSQQTIMADTGYELASVTVNAVDNTIDSDIVATNIKQGVNILGVDGSVVELKGETKTVTPSTSQQVVEPSSGKNGITEVTVEAVTSSIDQNIVARKY